MKNFFKVKLVCPFCKEEIQYNILSFKAKHECNHCGNELIVRTRPIISTVISILGFVILFALMDVLGITKLGTLARFAFILVGCFSYLALAYKLISIIVGANKIYAVDAQDPTLLKRYKKK